MDRPTLERRLTIALSNLIVNEWRLLTIWAPRAGAGAERGIAATLGWHIKVLMERRWDIDCEYNRAGMADGAAVKRWRTSHVTGGPEGSPVTPDLIVHRRGVCGKANNLLVLELKKNDDGSDSSAKQTSGGSLESILDIQKRYGYQHAVLLNLRLTEEGPSPHWSWIEFAERSNEAAREPHPVYDALALKALCSRGKAADKCRYSGS